MKTATIDRLIALAMHPNTSVEESVAALRRIVSTPGSRLELAGRLADNSAGEMRSRYDHNRAELQRAIATIARLRTELADAERRAAEASSARPESRARANPSTGSGRPFRRGSRPVVALEAESATCADDSCGETLHRGDSVRVYPGGRVYGVHCHGRRTA